MKAIWLIQFFLKASRTKKKISTNQGKYHTELDDVAIKTCLKEFIMEHVSQKMFSNVASADFYTNVNYYYRLKKIILYRLWQLYYWSEKFRISYFYS